LNHLQTAMLLSNVLFEKLAMIVDIFVPFNR
jgi:hypothetical protein